MDGDCLPTEVLEAILRYLDGLTLIPVLCVNKRWNNFSYLWENAMRISKIPFDTYRGYATRWQQVSQAFVNSVKYLEDRKCVFNYLTTSTKDSSISKIARVTSVWQNYILMKRARVHLNDKAKYYQPEMFVELWDFESKKPIWSCEGVKVAFIANGYAFKDDLTEYYEYMPSCILPYKKIGSDYKCIFGSSKALRAQMPANANGWTKRKLTRVLNLDPTSTLIGLQHEEVDTPNIEVFVFIFDLDQEKLILKVEYHRGFVPLLYGHKMFFKIDKYLYQTDVYTGQRELLADDFDLLIVKGNTAFGKYDGKLTKLDLTTREKTILNDLNLHSDAVLSFCNGLLVLIQRRAELSIIDPRDGKLLRRFSFEGEYPLQCSELSNGDLLLYNEVMVGVFSLRKEIVEREMELLAVNSNGKTEAFKIVQGDLHKFLKLPRFTSKIFLENDNERYGIIFANLEFGKQPHPFAERLFAASNVTLPPNAIGRFDMDFEEERSRLTYCYNNTKAAASFPVWLFYEQLIAGQFVKSAPSDQWQRIKAIMAPSNK